MASKKSFKTALNPAAQFISIPEAEVQEEPTRPVSPERLRSSEAPEGYKVNPAYIEKKTRRLQLLMRPSLYDKLKARAQAEGQSVNEMIDTILEDALK